MKIHWTNASLSSKNGLAFYLGELFTGQEFSFNSDPNLEYTLFKNGLIHCSSGAATKIMKPDCDKFYLEG